ncbi:hypothetical protein B5S33_g3988 [[Candida] boidinii]|nr:hypothetical protein B5S33_g3988 [[Candida] boidinii]
MSVKQQSIKQLVTLLEKLPNEKINHYASFKTTQIERFCSIGEIPVPNSIKEEIKRNNDFKNKKMIKINTDKLKSLVFNLEEGDPDYRSSLYNEKIVGEQIKSVKSFLDNKYSKLYPVGDKFLKPKGNPNYYTRLMNDINQGGQKKESIFDAFKTIFTGKY